MKCSMCPGRVPHPKPIQMRKGEFTHDLLHYLHYSTNYFKCFVLFPLRIRFEISAVTKPASDWSTDSTQGILGLLLTHA